MAPHLRVLTSTSTSAYPPTSILPVNSLTPSPLKTPHFEGEVSVWVKDFTGEEKKGDGEEYFGQEARKGMTYAIVIRGRFLDEVDADELVFGNLFQKPIKDQLPWGTSIAIKAMQFVDPNLSLDVYANKPWALSPTLATFNFLSLSRDKPDYAHSVEESSLARLKEMYDASKPSKGADGEDEESDEDDEDDDFDSPPPSPALTPADEKTARKRWLGSAEHRQGVVVDRSTWVGMEFCNGYLDFNTLSARLPQPFNLSFPLLQYWDGQPVTYICKRKASEGEEEDQGIVYFSVAFEIVDEEARKQLEERGGSVLGSDDEEDEGEGKDGKPDDVD